MAFRFIVDIPPTGKARPRMTRSGHVYTPKETVEAERKIAEAFLAAGGKCIPKGCEVGMEVTAYFPIPRSFSQRKREAVAYREIFPTKKPDADNILKLAADALNGVAYADDAQIVRMEISKEYSDDAEGYMEITICGGDE